MHLLERAQARGRVRPVLKGGLPEWVNSAFECVDLVFCGSGRKGNLYNVGTASRSRSVWVPTDMARAYGSESIGFQAAVEHKPAICGVRSFIASAQQSTFVQHRSCTSTHSLTQTKKASSSLLDGITPRRPNICHIFGPDPRFSF